MSHDARVSLVLRDIVFMGGPAGRGDISGGAGTGLLGGTGRRQAVSGAGRRRHGGRCTRFLLL